MKEDIYVYEHAGKLYVNLTNQCTNACTFCLRNHVDGIDGQPLWLTKEPTAREVMEKMGDLQGYEEVVFCGFGEPVIKLDEIKEIAAYAKGKGKKTRLNTNGQGSAYHGRNIAPELKGLIDTVSISLNASSAEHYDELCRSIYGKDAYSHLLEFAESCVKEGIRTVLSVVDVVDEDEIERSRRIAEGIGATLRVRKHY
jgi:TatD family-associated radical SAM protein